MRSWRLAIPVVNFGTVVGENPTPYGNLALWAVNGLSIVYWEWWDTMQILVSIRWIVKKQIRVVPDYTGKCHDKLWMWYDNAPLASYRACYTVILTTMFFHGITWIISLYHLQSRAWWKKHVPNRHCICLGLWSNQIQTFSPNLFKCSELKATVTTPLIPPSIANGPPSAWQNLFGSARWD